MPLLKRGSKRQGTRLYVVSDFHASDPAWRKLLNAVRLNAYRADAVLYAGDLTGKAIVPIVEVGGDRYEATLLGQRRVARDEDELAALERDVASLGYYAFRTTKEEMDALGGDPAKLAALFEPGDPDPRQAVARRWRPTGWRAPESRSYLIPGNDDPYDHRRAARGQRSTASTWTARIVDIPGGFQVIGLGKSSPTPWN